METPSKEQLERVKEIMTIFGRNIDTSDKIRNFSIFSHNDRKTLEEEQFCGFAYFFIELWFLLASEKKGDGEETKLSIFNGPVADVLVEMLEFKYAERQYYKMFKYKANIDRFTKKNEKYANLYKNFK